MSDPVVASTGTTVIRSAGTEGTSPKTRLVAALQTLVGAVLVLLALIFPDALTSQVQAAIIAVVMAAAGAYAAWKGEPGDQIVATFPLDDTPGLEHKPEQVT